METSALKKLCGAYYHQDFYEVHGGLWETLRDFVLEEPVLSKSLPSEIDEVLASGASEKEVDALLDHLGCSVFMGDEPGGYRAWLEEIADRVRRGRF